MPAVTYIDESLIQLLLADAGVVAIAGTRIYSTQAPQGTAMPCIVFTRETQGRGPYMHMSGMTGLIRATYTVSADGKTLTIVTKGNNYGVEYGSTQVFEKAAAAAAR